MNWNCMSLAQGIKLSLDNLGSQCNCTRQLAPTYVMDRSSIGFTIGPEWSEDMPWSRSRERIIRPYASKASSFAASDITYSPSPTAAIS
jgi:hypothetical protein